MRKINKIVFHVSDSPDTLDIGVKEIRRWHTDPPPIGRGWSDIGYHYVVRRDGTLEVGRPVELAGAHTQGHNADSIGICWVGRDRMSVEQHESMIEHVSLLLDEYGLSIKDVYGHREFNPGKTCPNYSPDQFRDELTAYRSTHGN